MAKGSKKKRKTGIRVFTSDTDLYRAFVSSDTKSDNSAKRKQTGREKNRHGLPVLDGDGVASMAAEESGQKETDFESLLEASFKEKKRRPGPGKVRSVNLKKRLKRYPPPEIDLDLHGYTAIGAELKAKNFLTGCKQQGYFTVRIIVGRGLHSDLGAVLPDVIEDVAKQLKAHHIVLSYRWEKKKKSASGALIVYLKQFDTFD